MEARGQPISPLTNLRPKDLKGPKPGAEQQIPRGCQLGSSHDPSLAQPCGLSPENGVTIAPETGSKGEKIKQGVETDSHCPKPTGYG